MARIASAKENEGARVRYLVTIAGVGIFVACNLTPDKGASLSTWTKQQIADAITHGVRPDGRMVSPIMPQNSFAHLTHRDALAIAAYLRTLKPVVRQVPG